MGERVQNEHTLSFPSANLVKAGPKTPAGRVGLRSRKRKTDQAKSIKTRDEKRGQH